MRTVGLRPVRSAVRLTKLSSGRLLMLDVLRLAARQPTIHGLAEVDVTTARERMRSASERPTMTAFVVTSLARAVREVPEVNVRRAGRSAVQFRTVDITVTVERVVGGELLPVPFVVHDADRKSLVAITAELRAARSAPVDRPEAAAGRSMLAALPPPLRRLGAITLGRFPRAAALFGPPIGVSSLGMFGSGWGIPLSPMTVMVTVGGITARPVLVNGEVTTTSSCRSR
jgi:pyruvate/2-oxoglutarate dehydrogenase complex dihydrolipoamide acyltransferase (E2) component